MAACVYSLRHSADHRHTGRGKVSCDSPGDPLSVEWLWNSHLGFTNTRIAYKEFRDPFCALLDMLVGEEGLATKDGMCHAATTGKADVRFSCDDFPDPKNDLKIFRKYIFPGKYWEEKGQP